MTTTMLPQAPIEPDAKPPVEITGWAHRELAAKMREWSGWDDAILSFGVPTSSPYAECNTATRRFTVNADALVRNPSRYLNVVTPFRLHQEAVLTGAMLHEAGHARFTRWLAHTTHGDTGKPVSPQTRAFALLLEEPRVEGNMNRVTHSGPAPATGYAWTMTAMAMTVLPMTEVSDEPGQAVMDLLGSWVLRAGRRYAMGTEHVDWVGDFTALVHETLVAHFDSNGETHSITLAGEVVQSLIRVCCDIDNNHHGSVHDTSSWILDETRDILTMLFPETDDDMSGVPMPMVGTIESADSGDGDGESADSGDGEGQGSGEADGEADGEGESKPNAIGAALAEIEDDAKTETSETETKASDEATEQAITAAGGGAGRGVRKHRGKSFREPTAAERKVKKDAESFLRRLIAPDEATKTYLTESPSATVDPAALSAWRAGGQTSDPRFFKRIHRNVEPSPPVNIGVCVDISGSMDEMQAPSSVLSWALASAAVDLRNFAGRGVQIESCFVHWGDGAEVIQHNGELLPGIVTDPCRDGTFAVAQAMRLVEEEMPGFYDITETPKNRLLIHFTDWGLTGGSDEPAKMMRRAFASGVNVLSVVPKHMQSHWMPVTSWVNAARRDGEMVGRHEVLRFDGDFESVWATAAEMLSGSRS